MNDQFPPAQSAREGAYPVSKKVNSWQTLVYVPLENNYEYVS